MKARHEKSGSVLTVRLGSGGHVAFRDKVSPSPVGGEDVVERYDYEAYLPQIAQHLVRVSYYEGEGFRIVDDRTGATAGVLGPPVVSPKGRWFACADSDAAYGDLGIEVWSTGSKPPKRVFHAKKAARPVNIAWLDDARFRVELLDEGWALIGLETYGWDGTSWGLRSKCGSEYLSPPDGSTSAAQLPRGTTAGEQALPLGCEGERR